MHTIRAAVAASAIAKVTRLFNGTLTDIANELLQNARRSGATCVTITVHEPGEARTLVTIADDGHGITDPAAILSLGDSDWPADLTAREDPAGMGFFALAGLEVRVETREFCLSIAPDAWTGERDIPIEPGIGQAGTAITFSSSIASAQAIAQALEPTIKYYPLPVTINGAAVARTDFLAEAHSVVETEGLRIGVFRAKPPAHVPNINFHGLTLSHKLPEISEVRHNSWFARIDIVNAPQLALVLPARKELFRNAAAEALEAHCLAAIFAAIADEPFHRLSHDDWTVARRFHSLPEPPAQLSPWVKTPAYEYYRNMAAPGDVPAGAIIYKSCGPYDDVSLYRALSQTETGYRLFDPTPEFAGYCWYDALPQYETTEYLCLDQDGAPLETDQPTTRPHRLAVRLVSPAAPAIELQTDAVVFEDIGYTADDVAVAVTTSSAIDADALATMIYEAAFSANEDADADSWDHQSQDFRHEAQVRAVDILHGSDAAIEADIRLRFLDEIAWRLPRGKRLTIDHSQEATRVTIAEAKEAGA